MTCFRHRRRGGLAAGIFARGGVFWQDDDMSIVKGHIKGDSGVSSEQEAAGLFDLAMARRIAREAARFSIGKGLPVHEVVIIEGERRLLRDWQDGRVEILEAEGWRTWRRP